MEGLFASHYLRYCLTHLLKHSSYFSPLRRVFAWASCTDMRAIVTVRNDDVVILATDLDASAYAGAGQGGHGAASTGASGAASWISVLLKSGPDTGGFDAATGELSPRVLMLFVVFARVS